MDDASLVRDCLSGSEKACKALFDRYAPSMLAMCVRYSSSRPEAEDNLQEGFIKIFQNLEQWKSTGALGAWICRVILNTCLTKIQTSQKEKLSIPDSEVPELLSEPEVISSLAYRDIIHLIDTMPLGYRTVFNLHMIDGHSYQEIAGMLQITESTCRSQVLRAKKFLANKITRANSNIKVEL